MILVYCCSILPVLVHIISLPAAEMMLKPRRSTQSSRKINRLPISRNTLFLTGPALSLQTTNNLHPLPSLIRPDVFSLYQVSEDLERRIFIRIFTCLPRYHIPGIWIYKAWTVSHSTKKISYLSSVPIPSTHFGKLCESFLKASKFLEANFVVSITVFV